MLLPTTCHQWRHSARAECDAHMLRVGQNHIYTVCIQYFWLGNHHICGHIRRIYTVLANPTHARTERLLHVCRSGEAEGTHACLHWTTIAARVHIWRGWEDARMLALKNRHVCRFGEAEGMHMFALNTCCVCADLEELRACTCLHWTIVVCADLEKLRRCTHLHWKIAARVQIWKSWGHAHVCIEQLLYACRSGEAERMHTLALDNCYMRADLERLRGMTDLQTYDRKPARKMQGSN